MSDAKEGPRGRFSGWMEISEVGSVVQKESITVVRNNNENLLLSCIYPVKSLHAPTGLKH